MWNDKTINSSLYQILYFYETGMLDLQNATALCADLKRILTLVHQKCNHVDDVVLIYYNE